MEIRNTQRQVGKVYKQGQEIDEKVREISDRIASQLKEDIKIFGSCCANFGQFSIVRIDPQTLGQRENHNQNGKNKTLHCMDKK